MRKLLAYGLAFLLGASPALAAPQGVVNLAAPTGNVGLGGDGTNLLHTGAMCGAASAALYAICVNQWIINSSGQGLVLATLTGNLPAYAATPTFNLGTLGGAATAANQNVTAAGTSASSAQAVQGVTGGVPIPFTGSVTASVAPIAPPTSGTGMAPFTVSSGTPVTTTIAPTGQSTLVIVSANSTSNTMHCTLGATVASSDPTIAPGSQTAFAIGAATQFTCSVSAGSQLVSAYAGSGSLQSTNGLPPNVGSAGTSLTFAQTVQGATGGIPLPGIIAAGNDVSEGNITDTAWSGTGNSTVIAALKALYAAVTGPIAAGTNLIGGVNQAQWGGTNITNVPTAVGTAGTGNTPTVNAYIVGGAGSGGTAAADAATFTAGTTNMTPEGCEFTSGGATAIVTGHMGMAGCTAARARLTDKASVNGTALATATEAYGTPFASQTATVERIDAFVTNTNANIAPTDAMTTTTYAAASPTLGAQMLWNGTTYDRAKEGTGTGVQAVSLPTAQVTVDPCTLNAKTNLAISTNATALTQIIAASGSNKIYICSLALVAPGATAINFISGTGTNCGTSTAAVMGSTTAANGLSLAANGGLTLGNGTGTVAVTAASSELCTLQSNAVQDAGNLTYVQAP